MTLSSTIILAVLLDHWLGEPKKHHPLVAFGNLAGLMEKRLRHAENSSARQMLNGSLALLILVAPFTLFIWLLQQQSLIEMILAPLLLYVCIAAHSLRRHAEAVLLHLNNDDLANARIAVSYLVSRETAEMSEEDVRKAVIESVLENGADAVFAPLFWLLLAGPAGVLLHRLCNTLDAMWGYKNPRYLYFGRASARLDDLLNWLPARLTALSYALLGDSRLALRCWRLQAGRLESPNAGPVMSAGAGALNIQLGGPAYYHGRLKDKIRFGADKPTRNEDITRATGLINKTLLLWLLLILIGDYLA
ncbi:adenosylcobinamide-phosphate synthase CbiB [Methylomarinum sp. Ch1-1]|uniref:Cobalamin biosynthesis protein CobD n=1 Tax=Methylomarinum roseum TaxID=3067653 RepID=A0AAU7NVF9_9GAMM|nr:adenosylcobinamide-phosphate synthase CbiB [Methylomarinum sp. Ch1-1]MDP4523019.1 adenosylcobinamide-phosphate synthase CbiB [Methylomarinum sp. Ch1-1]